MFNIADIPAVRARLGQDAAAANQSPPGEPPADVQEQGLVEKQPGQPLPYPSKSLVMVDGRYRAVEQKK